MVRAHIYFEKWETETIEQTEERAIEVVESRFGDLNYDFSVEVNEDMDFEEIKVFMEVYNSDIETFNTLASQLNTQIY